MSYSDKEFQSLFGWNEFFQAQLIQPDLSELMPARVICEEKGLYRVQVGVEHTAWASVSGKLQFQARGRADFPAVGDWVGVQFDAQADRATIRHLFQRKGVIARKQVGASTDLQILAANVDWMFIATAALRDLNLRRLERYLSIAWGSGATPVILLTKADEAASELKDLEQSVHLAFPGIQVYSVSNTRFEEARFFAEMLVTGTTAVFVGSSGVGKSTLVNYLTGQADIKTQEVRDADGKGRHTTTSRHLYPSRFGGLVIDTPGMRELHLSDHGEGVQAQFAEVEDLISRCRFSDCRHETEPGCAVKTAIEGGTLSMERWQSYRKLEAEVRHALRKQDKAFASEERKSWKKKILEGRESSAWKRRGPR